MKFTIEESSQAKEIVGKMDFRQLLNQVICPHYGRASSREVQEYGGVFFHAAERNELMRCIDEFKNKSSIPPFIVSDLEAGAGDMILGAQKFPSMMALSQTNSPELVYKVGESAGKEASDLGYNWTFAPVADLIMNPDAPVVTTRSAGQDPDHVIKMISAYVKGIQENGMMATVKHFPGDGHSSYDQHLTTPINPLTKKEWRETSGKVFKEIIESGVKCVMPGHISLPAFDEIDEYTGEYPPATISKNLLIHLLREELGFEGLIVSDAVEMGGLVGYRNYFDVCALALENGVDVLLFPRVDEYFYEEIQKRVDSGMLSMEKLRERATRIISMKIQEGLFEEQEEKKVSALSVEEKASIAKEVVERSITLVKDKNGLIPFAIKKDTRVLHLVIMNNYEKYMDNFARMKSELEKYSDDVNQWLDPGPDKLFQATMEKQFDLIICSIGSRHEHGLNVIRLHDNMARNMMGGWTKLGVPVIFVAPYHPLVHKEYSTSIDTIINTYGEIPFTAEAVIKGITGELELSRKIYVHD
ncbi:glycoside hydrolase family 3 protein [Jeotgalibaca caeni]|uniref:glycoside hydrolase family 3 protein n=1 Tax=Jeotgalibaca caeni TaxID=3028623 RepID=UPI00237D66EF|nr:glycoside hydrolase family 3 N-terminal domain-containing protein [Jeotgalibaca caeni]MDE1549533.1 glycoside hydrolase family 3 N-terminal domain-containing protein [Jeotgalibaca caeni]